MGIFPWPWVKTDPRLDALLTAWDRVNQNVREIHYTIETTLEDWASKEKRMCRIEGSVKRPGLGRVDFRDEKGNLKQVLLWHDDLLYTCNLERKQLYRFDLIPDEWFPFGAMSNVELFGYNFSRKTLKEHFDLQLEKEDRECAYIRLVPRKKEDRSWVREIEIILNEKTYLVQQIRILDFKESWVIHDYQQIEINPNRSITLEALTKDLPRGPKGLEGWTGFDWSRLCLPVLRLENGQVVLPEEEPKELGFRRWSNNLASWFGQIFHVP